MILHGHDRRNRPHVPGTAWSGKPAGFLPFRASSASYAGTGKAQPVGETILLLDAEPVIRQVVTDILTRNDYRVVATGSLAEAIIIAREQRPDLLLSNVYVPGSTGREAAKVIQSLCPKICVLMVAGLPDGARIDHEFHDRVLNFFPKPFTAAQLTEKVRQVLADHSPGEPS